VSPSASTAPASATPSPSAAALSGPRVALLGDGLLDGSGLPDAQSLPYVLARFRPTMLLLDLGLGHESSDKVLTRVRDVSEMHLDTVVLWVGTYDRLAGNSPQQYGTNMGLVLDALKGTPVVLLPPIRTQGGPDVSAYAAALQQVAANKGVRILDVASALSGADWQPGGQDLGPGGEATVAAYLAKVLPTPSAAPPPAQPQKRVVLIGDSHSYGAGLQPPQDLPSLIRRARPDLDLIDTAVGGQESNDALSRARQFRLLHADEAVIWIGTQDADDNVPLAQYRDNVSKLVAALAPAHVILVTPIADYGTDPTLFAPYAAATRDLAQQLGTGLIDAGSFPRSAYQDDATHLDATAEVHVAQLYTKAL
jgi:hypothetical protein